MSLSPVKKRRIKEETGFQCAVPTCGSRSPLDVHHIIPLEDGGSDDDSNLICLCKNCHGLFHNGTINKISMKRYKLRIRKINTILDPYEKRYLEDLYKGDHVELPLDDIHLIRGLERKGFVRCRELVRLGVVRLQLTVEGRNFIEI